MLRFSSLSTYFSCLSLAICATCSPLSGIEILRPALECLALPYPTEINLKHTEGKGFDYLTGYTTLDLFVANPLCEETYVPFLDLRGHVFNNGWYAANVGLGFRWLLDNCSRIWGLNFYYDYRETSKLSYNQLAFGFESLGAWDFRINGYFPVGRKKTKLYNIGFGSLPDDIFLVKGKFRFAMQGIDIEAGYPWWNTPYGDFYFAIGPYHFWGESAKNAFLDPTRRCTTGCRLRSSLTFFNNIVLEGVTTYDRLFKWTGQVALTLNFSFGPCFQDRLESPPDPNVIIIEDRLYQPVIRNEIIVLDRVKRSISNPAILNPEFEL